jgi:hypothetical protein
LGVLVVVLVAAETPPLALSAPAVAPAAAPVADVAPGKARRPLGPGKVAGVAIASVGAAVASVGGASILTGVTIAWTPVVPQNRPGYYGFTANFGRTVLSQNFIFGGGLLVFMGGVTCILGLVSVAAGFL